MKHAGAKHRQSTRTHADAPVARALAVPAFLLSLLFAVQAAMAVPAQAAISQVTTLPADPPPPGSLVTISGNAPATANRNASSTRASERDAGPAGASASRSDARRSRNATQGSRRARERRDWELQLVQPDGRTQVLRGRREYPGERRVLRFLVVSSP